MKTAKDLKETLSNFDISNLKIERGIVEDSIQVTFAFKSIFSMPTGYDIVSFTITPLASNEACVSFTVKFLK